jgi:hypothetical protein
VFSQKFASNSVKIDSLKGAIMNNLESLRINLQLFAGDEDEFENDGEFEDDVTNDEFDVVDQTDDGLEDDEGENEDFTDPQESDKQSPQENAQFRKMRLKAEEEARKKFEAERMELQRLKQEIEAERQERKIREEHLTQEKIWEKADAEGVSESVARKLLEVEAKELIESEKRKVRERFELVENEKKQLQKDEFYNDIAPEMEKILAQRPDLNPSTVYYHLKGQMANELFKKASKNAEKRTIANVQDNMRRRNVPTSSSGASDTLSVLSKEGLEMANAFGNDPREVAKRVKQARKKQ